MKFGTNSRLYILSFIITNDITELLRELLRKHIYEGHLPDYYNAINKPKTPFGKIEEQLVLASPTDGYNKFDLSLLIKVLRYLCGAEVNTRLESLYRIRNAISHLPNTNISKQDFETWFKELCSLADFIEEKLGKPSRLRQLFCSYKNEILAENESIENQLNSIEYGLERLVSKGEDISNYDLEVDLCLLTEDMFKTKNNLDQLYKRLKQLEKYAHQIGKTLPLPYEACNFRENPDHAEEISSGQAGGFQTQIIKTMSFKQNQVITQQDTDCTDVERRHIQIVVKALPPRYEDPNFMENAEYVDQTFPGHTRGKQKQTTELTSHEQNQLKTQQKTDCTDVERRHIPPDNEREHSNPRKVCTDEKNEAEVTPENEGLVDKCVSFDSSIHCPVSLNHSRNIQCSDPRNGQSLQTVCLSAPHKCYGLPVQIGTTHEIANSQVNNQAIELNGGKMCALDNQKGFTAQINRRKLSLCGGTVKQKRNDEQIQKSGLSDKKTGCSHTNNNTITQLCMDCVDGCRNANIKKHINQNKVCFEKKNKEKERLGITKKTRTKYKSRPSEQHSHTRPFGRMLKERQKPPLQIMHRQFYYPIRLLNVTGVSDGRSFNGDRPFCWSEELVKDVVKQGRGVKRKARDCYDALGVDLRVDDDTLVTDQGEDDFVTEAYDGDVVILHSKFPQDRELAINMLEDLKYNVVDLTGFVQEEVQKPGDKVFDVRPYFRYKNIFVLVTRYYKNSPILQHKVESILYICLENKNVKSRLIPVMMDNISCPCALSPIISLDFYQTFDGSGMEQYYANKLQKLFQHRSLRRSISCV